jgi:hypothetical protein
MTAQDKAKELLSKMNVIHYMKLGGKNKGSKGLPVSMHDDQIKQCALIAVDEIIKAFYLNIFSDIVGNNVINFSERESNYWQEVKQEIEKL